MATTTRQAKAPAKATAKAPARENKAAKAASSARKAPETKRAEANGVPHPGIEWKALLEKSGMTQTELKKLTAVPGPRMNAVLNQRTSPTAEITVRFARALGLDEKRLWTKVSAYLLAEAQATVK